MLFAKKKLTTDRRIINTPTLLIALCNDIPVDFMAANSYCSAKLPKTIIDTRRIVKGNTSSTNRGDTKIKNFTTIIISRSLPANSDMYTQIDCNKKINIKIVKTLKKDFK